MHRRRRTSSFRRQPLSMSQGPSPRRGPGSTGGVTAAVRPRGPASRSGPTACGTGSWTCLGRVVARPHGGRARWHDDLPAEVLAIGASVARAQVATDDQHLLTGVAERRTARARAQQGARQMRPRRQGVHARRGGLAVRSDVGIRQWKFLPLYLLPPFTCMASQPASQPAGPVGGHTCPTRRSARLAYLPLPFPTERHELPTRGQTDASMMPSRRHAIMMLHPDSVLPVRGSRYSLPCWQASVAPISIAPSRVRGGPHRKLETARCT